jgi:hypothetical protein
MGIENQLHLRRDERSRLDALVGGRATTADLRDIARLATVSIDGAPAVDRKIVLDILELNASELKTFRATGDHTFLASRADQHRRQRTHGQLAALQFNRQHKLAAHMRPASWLPGPVGSDDEKQRLVTRIGPEKFVTNWGLGHLADLAVTLPDDPRRFTVYPNATPDSHQSDADGEVGRYAIVTDARDAEHFYLIRTSTKGAVALGPLPIPSEETREREMQGDRLLANSRLFARLLDDAMRAGPLTQAKAQRIIDEMKPRLQNLTEMNDLVGTIGNHLYSWSGQRDIVGAARAVFTDFIAEVAALNPPPPVITSSNDEPGNLDG